MLRQEDDGEERKGGMEGGEAGEGGGEREFLMNIPDFCTVLVSNENQKV